MTDTTSAGPPPGWLFDSSTGLTRWWDGTRWTEHVQPAPVSPAYSQAPAYGQTPWVGPRKSTTNGSAVAAIFVLGALLLISGVPYLFSFGMPTFVLGLFSLLVLALTLVGFVLSVVGMVVAIRRPTRKPLAIVALVLGSLAVLSLIARVLVTML